MIVRSGTPAQLAALPWHWVEIGDAWPVEPTVRRLLKQAVSKPVVELICPVTFVTEPPSLLTQNVCLLRCHTTSWARTTRGVDAVSLVPEFAGTELALKLEEQLKDEREVRSSLLRPGVEVVLLDGFGRGYTARVLRLSPKRATVEIELRTRRVELVTPRENCKVVE